jgi:hypothetical protein
MKQEIYIDNGNSKWILEPIKYASIRKGDTLLSKNGLLTWNPKTVCNPGQYGYTHKATALMDLYRTDKAKYNEYK